MGAAARRWSLIAGRLPGRSDNEIKNYWNTHLSRRIVEGGHNILQDSYKQDGELISTDHEEGSSTSEFIQGATRLETHHDSVIRTKATRCRDFFIPRQLHNEMEKNATTIVKIPEWGSDQRSGCLAQLEDISDENFLMDYVVNDLSISDCQRDKYQLNECENMVNGDKVEHTKNNIMSSCRDQDFVVSRHDQAMRENWRQTEPFQLNDDALDLKSLTALLNLEDEWIS